MSYEPQQFDARKIVIGPFKQTTYGTALLDASLAHGMRFDGGAFAEISKEFRDDLDRAGKGHPWATEHQEIARASGLSFEADLYDFLAGWIISFMCSKDTITGASPYTHTCIFEQATNIAPVTSVYFQDTADLKFKLMDLAIAEATFSGGANGAIRAAVSLVGSGKHLDGAYAGAPAPGTMVYLLGSDTDIKIGAVGAAASIKERVRGWTLKITTNTMPHRAPGGGLYSSFHKLQFPRVTLSLQVAAKDVDDLRTLFLADTIQEVQINTNSGASAQLNFTLKGVYLSAAKLGVDGNEEIWSLDADEKSVIKNAGNEILTAVAINSQAASYLVAG
jgi:hypothetical protein